jgi:ribonuclease BN (tRNA processing enzyme)
LGTSGGPTVQLGRSQIASAVIVDGVAYLVDAGDGVSHQLKHVGLDSSDVGRIFLTHLHYDHVGGLPSLMMFNWVSGYRSPVEIFGPPGTNQFVTQAINFLDLPAEIYGLQLPPHPKLASLFASHDIAEARGQVVYADARVSVRAVENSHFTHMDLPVRTYGKTKSYAYRFDTKDRSVVFTGDTGPSEAVSKLASGADVLVAEVIDVDAVVRFLTSNNKTDEATLAETIRHMREEHLTPDEVGKLAAQAGVKMVVLSHIAPGSNENGDSLRFTAGVRKHFGGVVISGRDLDQF